YRTQGSSGGHNGVKSIIELLNSEEFKRLRVGIDYERNFLIKEWVLGNFSSIEKQEIKKIMPNLIDSLLAWIKENNFVKIMNKFNK
ncbi:MAG: aminoacyl-tRNA hydrolase, partial [Candidatus Moeniiplasma glomeromycotorum]|nr:aminoacyl-tRNA hydrolase [Candidatus Moeniiplasma glomeromycotorum]